jgi:hypothetical protein
MTSACSQACLGVLGVLLLCGCPQNTSTSGGPAGSTVVTGKALATIHVPGMTERLELF